VKPELVGVVGAAIIIASVLRLVLNGRLTVRYATLWLLLSIGLGLLAVVPGLLTGTARLLGFTVAANLLFTGGMVLLLLVGVHLSIAVTRLEQHVQRLAEEVALIQEARRAQR
jgi:hypothetical protein